MVGVTLSETPLTTWKTKRPREKSVKYIQRKRATNGRNASEFGCRWKVQLSMAWDHGIEALALGQADP